MPRRSAVVGLLMGMICSYAVLGGLAGLLLHHPLLGLAGAVSVGLVAMLPVLLFLGAAVFEAEAAAPSILDVTTAEVCTDDPHSGRRERRAGAAGAPAAGPDVAGRGR